MASLAETLFGPLSRDYCIWFYFLSILNFVWLVLFLAIALYMGMSKRKGSEYWLGTLSLALGYGIFYFQNRLMHSMCVGTFST